MKWIVKVCTGLALAFCATSVAKGGVFLARWFSATLDKFIAIKKVA